MAYPPSKRIRGFCNDPVAQDVFSDDADFTQDDLEEMDIIASQAIINDAHPTSSKRPFDCVSTRLEEQNKAPVREARRTFTLGIDHPGGGSNVLNNRDQPTKHNTCGHNQDREELDYSRLEAQQAELKRKLKEVEEQILMKNGEIRVLRDSLKQANQEKEQEKRAHLELERQRTHVQSEKEKELSKKVEALQSELHFKEAEMNEMRSKLQSSERGVRLVGTPVRNGTNSPGGRVFVTKETFSAEIHSKTSASKDQPSDGGKQSLVKKETAPLCVDESNNPVSHHKGPVLLNLLLQHPLESSSLGLCHLLCISSDVLPAVFSRSTSSGTSSASSHTPSTEPRQLHQPQGNFYQHQRLAMSALSTLAHSSFRPKSCPVAVHFLPLIHYHVTQYCQTLETMDRTGNSPLRPSSLSGSSDSSTGSILGECLGSHEEFALAALRVLYYVVLESQEAADSLLTGGPVAMESENTNKKAPVDNGGESAGRKRTTSTEAQSHGLLLKNLVQLANQKFVSKACRRKAVVDSSLRTLCALAERTKEKQLWRLQSVLTSQVLVQSVSPESAFSSVQLVVRFLALMVDCDQTATLMCSHHHQCLFVPLFQYVTTRADKLVTLEMWSCLEVEVVRLLTRLFMQKSSTWETLISSESTCRCSSQVVRTVVMVLHRQWLSLKSREKHVTRVRTWTGAGVQSLRETLMLLHWLLINDASLSMHCLDVMHMYHQIIPNIRDTFRLIPDLSESEELALDDLCRSEAEDVEDMDIDAGS